MNELKSLLFLLPIMSSMHAMVPEKIEVVQGEEKTNSPLYKEVPLKPEIGGELLDGKLFLEFLSTCHADFYEKVRPDYASMPSYNHSEKIKKYPYLGKFLQDGLQEDLRLNQDLLSNMYAEVAKKSEFLSIYKIKIVPKVYEPKFNEKYLCDKEYKKTCDGSLRTFLTKTLTIEDASLFECILHHNRTTVYNYYLLLHPANMDIDQTQDKSSDQYASKVSSMLVSLQKLKADYFVVQSKKTLALQENKKYDCCGF